VSVWDRTLAVNLSGAMLMVRACLERPGRLRPRPYRQRGLDGGTGGITNISPYSVSKHGLVGFTRSLAGELGGKGVTANCVCPGATLTGMTELIPKSTERSTPSATSRSDGTEHLRRSPT